MVKLPESLSTERLILRRLKYEDAEEIFYTYSSKAEATRFVSWPTHKRIEDTLAFLSHAIEAWALSRNFTYTVRLKRSNRLIGSIGVVNQEGNVQIGYIFSPTQWNRGYATEVCRKIVDLLKDQKEVFRISSFVDVENQSSARVLEKSGLQQEGVFAKWFRFPNQNFEPRDCILFVYRKS